jgi:hypothetical protein
MPKLTNPAKQEALSKAGKINLPPLNKNTLLMLSLAKQQKGLASKGSWIKKMLQRLMLR